MSVLTDAIADAKYRELERKWRREDPRAYQRLCEIRAMYPFIEWTNDARGMARLQFERYRWQQGDER